MIKDFLDRFEAYSYPLHGYIRLPEVVVPQNVKRQLGIKSDADNYEVLRQLVWQGFQKRVPKDADKQIYLDRISHELKIIKKLGFVEYYLLVWKRTNFCDEKSIARGKGRGSCANSALFWLLGVTLLDPIKYNLWFERFVSEARAKKKEIDGVIYVDGSLCPDVDLDIQPERHHEVITQLNEEYPNRIAQILTVNTLTTKSLITDCCKVIGEYPNDEAKFVSKMIPVEAGFVRDLKDTYEGIKKDDSDEWEEEPVEDFVKWVNSSKLNKRIYNTALKLRECCRSKGVHPSGFFVSYNELDEYIPRELAKSEDESGEQVVCVSVDMKTAAELGCKLDLLRLGTCSVIDRIIKLTGESDEDINIDSDPIIYNALQDLKANYSIFQLEGGTALRVCQKIKPKNLNDLSAVLALARPGGISFVDKYAENKCEPVHPIVDEALKNTRGICVYQETVMAMFKNIGFTLEEGELIRRVIGKKDLDKVGEWKSKIYEKCKENNLPVELGDLIWKIVSDSAKYQFNAGHSFSYSAIAAILLYYKNKYPKEFFWSCLIETKNKPDPVERVRRIDREMRMFGLKLLPPDLLKSDMDFTIEGENVRVGLGAIKSISGKTFEALQKFKTPHSNKFELFSAASNAGLSINHLCSIIYAGALDFEGYKQSRARLALEAQLFNIISSSKRLLKLLFDFGPQFNYDVFLTLNHLKNTNDSKGKPYLKESQFLTVEKKYSPHKEIYLKNKDHVRLTNFWYERNLIGFSHSTDLHTIFKDQAGIRDLMTIKECLDSDDANLEFVGIVEGERAWKSKKGNACIKLEISDGISILETIISNNANEDKIQAIKNYNQGELPKEGDILHCIAQKKNGSIYIQKLAIQTQRIFTRYADLKKDREKEAKPIENA